ncbi:1-deoxy-D-xylulose-5-phosphate synthase N-terminal domain-containing protein [Candidatus Purcelliella pentastirinorum]|uniref:1-deoxy-D-xylulose-5-phosphate synthase N-terminal domain-containing protein n=1 Tax=Candidatus Purcelliella pentastirinorum TaxID=472834 RepID=UPI002A4E12BF|nr:1-deoxy-D-xylulose-5-phosphate synthase N-terminal domain-containing protein [Candidatus Purcelliella pentastirinorum]
MLTGRFNKIYTIRKIDGLNTFTCREESEFDVFTVGHFSTSISAVLGMVIFFKREK